MVFMLNEYDGLHVTEFLKNCPVLPYNWLTAKLVTTQG